ncbi:uncharacterized protein BO96DRAFT_345431 [Aspergillus niger CBS 101883]|uniref:uncharacterized protein n=1 Tax=Aspergillus lacticoffeatus (strain CBS 101883) TaxID=1450533 RepID=UPI000D7EEA18|nr:uncharacterized protein BO96DRAFT_345431 [Aspergillus niger CBS 101883]PYH53411.1 hypothetical protein BO96DRAFT_345431 [Aspergillus niger CBS 101883]
MELRYLFPPPPRIPVISKSGQSRHGGPLLELDEVACGLLGGYEISFRDLDSKSVPSSSPAVEPVVSVRYMRQKSDWLGLALEDGGSPYYKRGRGDRSAIDSESLLGWTVVTPLLNVALCVRFLFISNVKAQPRMRNAAGYIKSIIHAVDFR